MQSTSLLSYKYIRKTTILNILNIRLSYHFLTDWELKKIRLALSYICTFELGKNIMPDKSCPIWHIGKIYSRYNTASTSLKTAVNVHAMDNIKYKQT
jgi:hypothetical protein